MRKVKQQAETWTWVPPSDRELPPEEQSSFVLKPLTQAELMKVVEEISWTTTDAQGNVSVNSRAFSQARKLVLSNLVEVRNFPAGEPVPWPTNGNAKARDDYLNMFDFTTVFLIGNEIRERSALEPEVKNS